MVGMARVIEPPSRRRSNCRRPVRRAQALHSDELRRACRRLCRPATRTLDPAHGPRPSSRSRASAVLIRTIRWSCFAPFTWVHPLRAARTGGMVSGCARSPPADTGAYPAADSLAMTNERRKGLGPERRVGAPPHGSLHRSSPVSAAGPGARAHPAVPIRVCRNNDLADRLDQHIAMGKLPLIFDQCQWLV